eukprot:6754050-Prymnesium_polylepis.1
MSNKLKIIYDYRQYKEPIELHDYLKRETIKKSLYDMKVMYVVKPNADNMVKFGIAGHQEGKASAWGRLSQYVNQHGIQDKLNQCAGVQLLYLVGNKYNPEVEPTNSIVYKKEKYIKDHFKFERQLGRGTERVLEDNVKKLIRLINDTRNK